MGAAAAMTVVLALAFGATARAAGDTVQTWGYNADGELGNGMNVDTSMPGPVTGLTGVTAIAGGANHSLARLSDGSVKVWGSNFDGQLGNGNNTGPDTCPSACSESPISVPGLSHVIAVAAGDDHSLALLANGTVMAWGDNARGQLGNGNATGPDTCPSACSKSPIPVGGLSHVVAIAAGGFHNLALLANGTVVAWGNNSSGELGNGTNTGPDTCGPLKCSTKPIPVSGVSGVVAISAGLVDSQSVALLSNGTLMDWGLNSSGELGNGSNTGPDTCGAVACSKKPIAVGGLAGVVSIAAASGYTLARLSNGTARAWGYNANGNLGDGTTTDHYSPKPVGGLSGAAQVAVGDGHSLALLSNGTAKSWGRNDDGQLGIGNNTGPDTCGGPCSKNAVAVTGLSGITAIAAGFAHSLALVGPSQALHIALAGRGAGAVGGAEILCPRSCTHRYPQGAVVSLLAHASAGTGFAGYTGACHGTRTCRVTMSKVQDVTATFGRPKETRITSAKIKKNKKKKVGTARFRFTAPGAITGFECALLKPKHGKHKKKPKPHFSRCGAPKRYKHLKPGRYTFQVRALDILGADPVPAQTKFRI